MPNQSVFSQEWRDCLRAHYTTVVRNEDHGTERTLQGVMLEAGFSEDELKQLYVRATAHVDDVGADFVPDMDILEAQPESFSVASVAVPEQEAEAEAVAEALAEATTEAEAVIEEIAAIEGESVAAAEIPVEIVKDLVEEDEAEVDVDAEATDVADEDTVDDDDATPDEPDATQMSLF